VQFTSLKLTGFKSFVEPSEFLIETGVTGIVGPNGCGKSNLLEALRWVMGANSAKAMRAGAMDDVIFSGTGVRPARNHATVTLTIDNSERSAPSQFNDADVLEISRKINRGAGSSYHINGKSCRAKDVQLLFADASTGANSPALVRQGQINELITAKPQNRRRVLEEAAGISGLHTRRHEAELRLRAAETNLSRLDDIGEELELQHQQLKRQVRIASRYRNLASEIRALEAFSFLLRWTEAKTLAEETKAELDELEQKSGELAGTAARALVASEAAAYGIEELREEQAIATALVARLSAARASVERDEQEAKSRQLELEERLQEITRDLTHQTDLAIDANQTIERLQTEQQQLSDIIDSTGSKHLLELKTEAKNATDTRKLQETAFEKLMSDNAQRQALINNAQNILSAAQTRHQRIEFELNSAKSEIDTLSPDLETLAALRSSEEAQQAAALKLSEHQKTIREFEQKSVESDEKVANSRQDFDTTRRIRDQLNAEQSGLQQAIQAQIKSDFTPVSEELKVSSGYERALAAALGDDLDYTLDQTAPAHWSSNEPATQSLPETAKPLNDFVTAPLALASRLSQIGVVEFDSGEKLSKKLLPGQRLVSREGHLWRWDGLVIRPEAPSAAALRLEQKNRLSALEPLSENAINDTNIKRDLWLQAKEVRAIDLDALKTNRQQLPTIEKESRDCEAVLQELNRSGIEREARFATLQQKIKHWTNELKIAAEEVKTATSQPSIDDNTDDGTSELQEARELLDLARKNAAEAEAALRSVQRENETRSSRVMTINGEIENWIKRVEAISERNNSLAVRKTETTEQLQQAKAAPNEINQRRKTIFNECEIAENRQLKASDALANADSQLREAKEAVKAADSAASQAREIKAGLQAKLESAGERLQEVVNTIRQTLDCEPEELSTSEQNLRKTPNDAHEAEARLHKLRLERDNIGGVNLQAEEQAEKLTARLQSMTDDRDELTTAISKLRKGVDSINQEGRVRLLKAFEIINDHFKSLFLTLFNGGEAELRLTESDDPLEAGLDIFACPPGKKMEHMSLMSGGEQALTAMALIFAVFLTNPAPVCVLDEVDAPWDDANVERFCTMLAQMHQKTDTRFIIITHNPLTMSRVDRLYGVTMAERGVSQLVSVDLQRAEDLIAAE